MTTPPTSKRGPGRPRKPAVPADPQNLPQDARSTPEASTDALEGQKALLNEALARQKAGKPLANHHARALRDAWLLAMDQYLWPSCEAAAAALGVSPATLRTYAADGCPGIEPHSPVPKAPVLAWLLARAHERGGERPANRETVEEWDQRLKRAKALAAEGSLVAEAEDRARQALVITVNQLRNALLRSVPPALYDLARSATDRTSGEEQITAHLDQVLRHHQTLTPAATPANQETTP